MPKTPERAEIERKLALARAKGFAITPEDVRRRFGDRPLTSEDIFRALADAPHARSIEVDANTSDEELDAFLFGDANTDK